MQRLLSAANYNVARAEQGIICLDEVDKIATAKVSHGKDVSGEGVQQALLKIVEGTTLQISAKQERGAGRSPSSPGSSPGGSGVGNGSPGMGGGGGKTDVFNVRTDNILFIFTGAFTGLPKIVMDRVSRGSMGFGQPVRAANPDRPSNPLKGEEHLYKKHLPFFTSNSDSSISPLDLVEPGDLQKFGLIPELVGRIPITTALSALDEEALVQVLTEPRNALLKQFEQQFRFSGVELHCTSGALREIARAALDMGTGARGLRTVMERLLGDAMFDAPGKAIYPSIHDCIVPSSQVRTCNLILTMIGSSIKFILVTKAVAQKKQAPIYLARGQQMKFRAMIDEEEWEARQAEERRNGHGTPPTTSDVGSPTFEVYREKAKAAGIQ